MRHPDEGTIHAWLDGALSPDESREIDAHVTSCADCAARVAEARGMVAGASRILAALDSAPAGVVPARSGPRGTRTTRWWRRPGVGVAAAMAIVAVGTTWAVTRDWARESPAVAEAVSPVYVGERDSVASGAALSDVASPGVEASRASAEVMSPERRERSDPPAATGAAIGGAGAAQTSRVAAAPETRAVTAERVRGELAATTDTRDARMAKAVPTEEAAPQKAAEVGRVLADAPVAPPAPASVSNRQRESAQMAPLVSRVLARSAGDLAGCYTLEVGEARGGSAPELPSIVQLLDSEDLVVARDAPRPAEGFRVTAMPVLVPVASDSGQIGWRLSVGDSLAVRLLADGRTVLLSFPAGGQQVRLGMATAFEPAGDASWSAPITVQRVPCPTR